MPGSGVPELLSQIERSIKDPREAVKAPNTLRAYRSDWTDFSAWCEEWGRSPLPADPTTLCLYLAEQGAAGVKPSTLRRRLAAIGQQHLAAGHLLPPTRHWSVCQVMASIQREHRHGVERKAALLLEELQLALRHLPAGTRAGARDRALLLLGFAGGLRRSELVGLDCEDLEAVEHGLRISVRAARQGRTREIQLVFARVPDVCPIRAVEIWRRVADIASGPLFRPVTSHDMVLPRRLTPQSVALVVKRAVERVGHEAERYAGQSLRSGRATLVELNAAPGAISL